LTFEQAGNEIVDASLHERSILAQAERLAPGLTLPDSAPGFPIPETLRRLWKMEESPQPASEPGVLAVQPVTIAAGKDAAWVSGLRITPLAGALQRLKARLGELEQALKWLDKA
jgi:hypothetical protein